jgi:hypothetical protein
MFDDWPPTFNTAKSILYTAYREQKPPLPRTAEISQVGEWIKTELGDRILLLDDALMNYRTIVFAIPSSSKYLLL